MKLLVSLPIHECRRVVDDQIRNINYFLDRPTIVVHISQSYQENADFSEFSNVLVNPQRLATAWGNISATHYSNIQFALRESVSFDFVVHSASNELYIRRGWPDYAEGCHALLDTRGTLGVDGEFAHFNGFYAKANLKAIGRSELPEFCRRHNSPILNAPIEGSAYRRDVIVAMYELIDREFGFEHLLNSRYVAEELLFPTVFIALQRRHGWSNVRPHTCFMDWRYELTERKWLKIVRHVVGGNDARVAAYLNYVDAPPEIFSIKRVPRLYFDPVRSYVRDKLMPPAELTAAQMAEYQRLDQICRWREFRHSIRPKALLKESRYWAMTCLSVLLGQYPSYIRFEVLEAWRRRRRAWARQAQRPATGAET